MNRWLTTGWVDEPPEAPDWLAPIARAVDGADVGELTSFLPPMQGGRPAAVLMLFGEDLHGPDVLLIKRAEHMRAHAGQPAFPGGAVDERDADPPAAALREAAEETGVDPAGVRVFGRLPDLWVPVTDFVVSPVLAWWQRPGPVRVNDPAEVASVHRVPLAALIEPENRCRIRHPSGYIGSGFEVEGLVVWGFTAGLLAGILDRSGLARPWDDSRVLELPQSVDHAVG